MAVSASKSAYISKEGNELALETQTVINSGKASHEKICELMARAVLLETVKKEQLSNKDGEKGPVEKMMSNPKTRKDMLTAIQDNSEFKSFVQNTSMDMLKHFFMIDGERNMEKAITEAGLKKQQHKGNEANAPVVSAEIKKENQVKGLN